MEVIYVIIGVIFFIGVALAIYEKRRGLKVVDETDPNPSANQMSGNQAHIAADMQRNIETRLH